MDNNKMKRYITIAMLAVIIIAIMYNKILGLCLTVCFIIYKSYTSRASIIALKAHKAFKQDKRDESIALFEKAYHTKGCTMRDKITYGFILLKYADVNKASEVFTKLMSEKMDDKDSNMIKSNYAMVLWKQGKLEEAISLLKELYKTYKTTALYGTLGAFLIEKGDLDEAYSFIQESYDYDNNDKVILDNLGQIYYLRGENKKALEVFKKLMALNPHFPEAYYDYGKALMKEGENQKALELSREALSKEFTNLSTITKDDVDKQIKLLEYSVGE